MNHIFKLNNEIHRVAVNEEKERVQIEINEETSYQVEYHVIDNNLYTLIIDNQVVTLAASKDGKKIQVFLDGDLHELEILSEREILKGSAIGTGMEVISPMPSRVVKILKKEGDSVELDESVVVVEAMKMESELKAPSSGKIKEIKVKEGDTVESGSVLVVLSSE